MLSGAPATVTPSDATARIRYVTQALREKAVRFAYPLYVRDMEGDDREQTRHELWQRAYDEARRTGASDDFARFAANQSLRRAESDVEASELTYDVDPYF